jgi:hypothetical protein
VVPLTRSSSCALYERAGRTAQCQPAASAAAHHACAVPDAAFCSNDSTSCSRSSSSKLSVVATVAASPHSSHSSPAWQLVATAGPLATLGVPEGSLPQHDCGTECQESGGAALSSSAAPEEGLCSPSLSHSSANDALQHSSEDAQQLNSSTEPQGWRAADASGDADADPLQPAADGAGLPLSTAADDLQATASFQVAHPAAVSCENSSAVPLAADSSASISPQNSSSSSSSFEAAAAGFAPAHSPAAPAAGEGAESLDVTDTATGCTTADSRSGLLVALTVLGDGRVLVGLMPWQAAHVASTAEQQTGDAALSCDAALALDFAAAAGAAQDAAQQASPGSCCGVLASDTSGSAADEHTTCADSPVAASDLGVAEAPSLAVVLQDAASSDHTATGLAAAPSGATLAVALSEAVPTAAEIMGEPCLLAAQASSGVHAQPSAADTADAQEATPATEAEAPPASMAANNCAGSEPAAVDAVSCQEPLPMDALSSASSSSLAQLVAEVGHAVAALAASPLQEADSPQQQPSQGGSTAEIGTPGLLAEVPSSAATSSQFDALTTGCGGCSVPAQAGCSVDAGTSSLRDAEQAASPTSTSLRGQQQLPAPLPSLPLLEGSASWGLMCAPTWQRAHSPFGSAAAQGVWDELAAAAPLQGVSTSTQQVAPGLPSHLEAGSCTLGAGSAASLGAGEGGLLRACRAQEGVACVCTS